MDSGRRAVLFSEVNDRIYELLDSAESDLPGEFLCECGHDCGRRVELTPAAFVALRDAGRGVRSAECRPRGLLRRRVATAPSTGLPALG